MTTRRNVLVAFGLGTLAASLTSFAQPQTKVWRIGFLAAGSSSTQFYDGFRQGMRNLGYVEGKNLVLESRFAEGRYERLPTLAAELVRLKVDAIVAGGTTSVQAAHKATSTIPIVLVGVPDPVGEGFVATLSKPGGNITGLSTNVTEVSIKHLELLRAAIPKLARVGVLINPLNPSDSLILEQIQGVAYMNAVKVVLIEASTAAQIESSFRGMTPARMDALIVAADEFFDAQRNQIVKLALKNGLPTIFSNRELTEAGGLMSYGPDLADHYRRAAIYVDKILKGAKPGNLPVEQPTLLELVINRKTAKVIGLNIPQELLLRADKVIE